MHILTLILYWSFAFSTIILKYLAQQPCFSQTNFRHNNIYTFTSLAMIPYNLIDSYNVSWNLSDPFFRVEHCNVQKRRREYFTSPP